MKQEDTVMSDSEQLNFAQTQGHGGAIATLNDKLRKQGTGGHIMVTRGVRSLPDFDVRGLLAAIAAYDAFDADNDPHGERDFGDLEIGGEDLLWKIDYYDLQDQFASPDPADPAVTSRVLTIMLASEY
jgi:hypothetical protein